MSVKTWTLDDIEEHIKVNVKDYSAAVVVAALFKKLYNTYPRIGLSGFQAEAADFVCKSLPDANIPLEPGRERE